jgi:adenosylhomocysteine nucleosidase
VGVSGARPDTAEVEARRLAEAGAQALLSVGLAGALAPGLAPGMLLVPRAVVSGEGASHAVSAPLAERLGFRPGDGTLLGSDLLLADVAAKATANRASGALAVDMESHRVARVAAARGLPFLVLRAIADPCDQAIPPAARDSVAPDGSVRTLATMLGLLRRPQDLPALIALGRCSAIAHATLREVGQRLRD